MYYTIENLQQEYYQRQKIYGRNLVESDDSYMTDLFPTLFRFLAINPQNCNRPKIDLLFTLVGFADEVSLLATCLLKPKKVILVHSSMSQLNAYRIEAAVLDAFADLEDLASEPTPEIDFLLLEELTADKIVAAFKQRWEKLDDEGHNMGQVAIDLTGGTSVMSVSGLMAMRERGVENQYYLDFESNQDTNLPIPGTNRLTSLIFNQN
ncbi:hypothetical protein CMK12_17985 [Candidatus Poribacteria bacterium]|nr:hypothetical protein [Candidatus Poribacteria bacterium]MDP6999503.1 hypothetical protein [Candidatus Poribacteria bacterium]